MTFFHKLQDKYRGGRRNEELEIYDVGKKSNYCSFHQDTDPISEEDLELTIETAILKNLKGEDE